MSAISEEARRRAHEVLEGKASCAPWEPHPDYKPFAPSASHDWKCDDLAEAIQPLIEERNALARLLNTPEVVEFARAVQLEAAHQRARWGTEHDAGKTDADWFWLIGYLAAKALHNPGGEADKQLHRIITVAAAAANWHAAKLGQTNMRPGIEPPAERARPGSEAGK